MKIKPLSSVRAVNTLSSRVWWNLTFLEVYLFIFWGKCFFVCFFFFVLVVLPREPLVHHRRLTTSAAQQGLSVPTFHEVCLLETLSTSVSREGHGISKARHIMLLQPRLPCLMAPANSGDRQPQASSANSPPSLCAGKNE